VVPRDIDEAMHDWPFTAGEIIGRQVTAQDGRVVLQLRIDMGIIQMEVTGRPDGDRPHGYRTYLDYLRQAMDDPDGASPLAELHTMTPQQCAEADREFLQFYQRRLCWLALSEYSRAVADADHGLAFMDFVKRHSPNQPYTESHERYRPFVLFHRAQAAAACALARNDPDGAVDALREGLTRIEQAFEELGAGDRVHDDEMVQKLRAEQQRLRQLHAIEHTLHEQLEEAVAGEDYERAAEIRDRIRARQAGNGADRGGNYEMR